MVQFFQPFNLGACFYLKSLIFIELILTHLSMIFFIGLIKLKYQLQGAMMEIKGKRMKVMNDLLSGIRVLKL